MIFLRFTNSTNIKNLIILSYVNKWINLTNNNPATSAGSPAEECNCDVTCPCVLAKEDPDEGYCNTTLAWHIQKGNYDNTIDLDGLNVVAVFHTPDNMLKGNW